MWFSIFLTLGVLGVVIIASGAIWRMDGVMKIASPLIGLLFHPFVIVIWFGIAWYEYRQMRAEKTGRTEDRAFMSQEGRKAVKKVALIGGSLVALYLVVVGVLVIAENRSLSSLEAQQAPASEVSDNAYTLSFASNMRGTGDGSKIELSSVVSDGTSAKVEGLVDSAEWGEESHGGIFESMGSYYGDFISPDGTKELSVEFGRSALLTNIFSIPKLYVTANDEKTLLPNKTLLLNGGFTEVEWFPDSRRVAVTDGDSISVLDTEQRTISTLADGKGWIKIDPATN